MNNQASLASPDLRSVLDQERDNSYSGLNCCRVGTIVSFDGRKVSVRLVDALQVFNQGMVKGAVPQDPALLQFPILQDLPVFVLFGGKAFIGMPIAAGDPCIVLFNDRDLDIWFKNGTTGAAPNSLRMHSAADGIAIVGIRPVTNPVPGLPTDGVHVTFGNDQTTLLTVIQKIVAAMLQLNSVKTGGDASAQINAVTTEVDKLLQ